MPVRASTVGAMALLAALTALCFSVKPAETVPGGFSDTKVTDSYLPTALDFTPDGRMLVASKTGQLYVYNQAGDRLANPALNLGPETCANSERGLLGVAVDPRFGTAGHNFVYLYYTYEKFSDCPTNDPRGPVNRVSRFEMNGNTVDRAKERVLIDNIPSPNGNHNAGDLHFDGDGKLYVSVGDGGCNYAEKTRCQYENDASRGDHVLLGKILRINPDGSIPADNPYAGDKGERCNVTGRTDLNKKCEETYASGFRNPFRFAIDPDATGATKLFANDVGGQRVEEVDDVKAGADHGWNICEGSADNPYRVGQANCERDYAPPIHQYNHNTGCESITAGAFVPGNTNWPERYRDAYLYGDFVCGRIFSLTPDENGGYQEDLFVGGLGLRSAVAMDFGPHRNGQALYYATFEDGGMIRRIAYTDGPNAEVKATPPHGDSREDLTIDFDASDSKDPKGDTSLTYLWDFDSDGTVDRTTTGPSTSHTYPERGRYTATLTVRNSAGDTSDPAKSEVFPGNTPPEPVIEGPADESVFRTGQEISATGSAGDRDDDEILKLRWEVVQHHDGNHTHTWDTSPLDVVANSFSFEGPAPEGLYSTDPNENYLEVRLTATDSLGLSKTATVDLRPKTTELAFGTEPENLRLTIAGQGVVTPVTITSWEGYEFNVVARRQTRNGRTFAFTSWSDGKTIAGRTIVTPTERPADDYTANFRRVRR